MRILNILRIVITLLIGIQSIGATSIDEYYDEIFYPTIPRVQFYDQTIIQIVHTLNEINNLSSKDFGFEALQIAGFEAPDNLLEKKISIGFENLTLDDSLAIIGGIYGYKSRIIKTDRGAIIMFSSEVGEYIEQRLAYESFPSPAYTKAIINVKNISNESFVVSVGYIGLRVYQLKHGFWTNCIQRTFDEAEEGHTQLNPEQSIQVPLYRDNGSTALLAIYIASGRAHPFYVDGLNKSK